MIPMEFKIAIISATISVVCGICANHLMDTARSSMFGIQERLDAARTAEIAQTISGTGCLIAMASGAVGLIRL